MDEIREIKQKRLSNILKYNALDYNTTHLKRLKMIKEIKYNMIVGKLKNNILSIEKWDNGFTVNLHINGRVFGLYNSYTGELEFHYKPFIEYCGIQDYTRLRKLLLDLLYKHLPIKDSGLTISWYD